MAPSLPIGRHELELFPGLLILLLAIAAVWLALRHKGSVPASFTPSTLLSVWARLYVFICVLALVLSLGPRPAAFGHQLPFPGPYAWMAAVLPGMGGLRAPARMATVVHLTFALLGAIGFAALTSRLRPQARRLLTVVTALVIALEGYGDRCPLMHSLRAG